MNPEPFRLTLSLTHRCDLRCRYCYAGRPRRESMSPATGRAAIRLAFRTAEADRVVVVQFFGGEPLLEFHLLRHLTRYANLLASRQGRSVAFALTTNGTHLSDDVLTWLEAHRFAMAVSVDGTPAMHDRHRRHYNGSGSSPAVFNRLQAALEYLPNLVAAMTVTPATAGALAEGVTYLFRLGVRHFEITPDYGAAWSHPAQDALQRSLAGLAAFYAEHFTTMSVSCLDDKVARVLPGGEGIRCGFGETSIAVAPSGRIYPCERLIGTDRAARWVIGTVETGFDQARRRRCLVRRRNDHPLCQECPEAGACRNACPCMNLARTGRPGRPDAFICACERALMAAATEVLNRVGAARRRAALIPLGTEGSPW